MRISDWGSDVCSSDLPHRAEAVDGAVPHEPVEEDQFLVGKAGIGLAHRQKLAVFGPASECVIGIIARSLAVAALGIHHHAIGGQRIAFPLVPEAGLASRDIGAVAALQHQSLDRCVARAHAPLLTRFQSEEHTSELQSLMRISYA